jgi:hypothetical protein
VAMLEESLEDVIQEVQQLRTTFARNQAKGNITAAAVGSRSPPQRMEQQAGRSGGSQGSAAPRGKADKKRWTGRDQQSETAARPSKRARAD